MGQTLGILEASMLIYVGPSNENLTQREPPLWTGKENSLHLINGKHFGTATAAGYWLLRLSTPCSTSMWQHQNTHTHRHARTHTHRKYWKICIKYSVFVCCGSFWALGWGTPTPSVFPAIALSFLCLFVLVFVQTFLLIKILCFSCEINMTMDFCQGVCLNSPQSRKI